MRMELPIVDFEFQGGLMTKFSPEKTDAKALFRSDNADGFDQYLSIGKVPGSSRKSDVAPGPWQSLHYFEHFDPTGVLQREVLGLSTGNLYRVETSAALTLLKGGLVNEALASCSAFNQLFLTSPSNAPLKYDGQGVSRWGVWAPGTEIILKVNSQTAAYAVNGTNTTSGGSTSFSGFGSAAANKLDQTTQNLILTDTPGAAIAFAPGFGSPYTFLYIPQGALTELLFTGNAVDIAFTGGGTSHWSFSVGQLHEGWNLLTLGTPTSTTGGGANLSAVTSIVLTIVFSNAGTVQSGFLWDSLLVSDLGQPSAALSGAGAIIGTVSYVVTYVSKYGRESNGGPASAYITCNGNAVQLGNIPVSPDPQVVARNLYRDNNDQQYDLIGTIQDNTTTSFFDNEANAARNILQQPPFQSNTQLDNTPPPKMVRCVYFKGYIFGIDNLNRTQLDISSYLQPEAFPVGNRKFFDEELITIAEHPAGLMLFGRHVNYIMTGDNLASFRFIKSEFKVGATGPRAVASSKVSVTSWHDDGPYLHDGSVPWFAAQHIKDQIEALDPNAASGVHCVYDMGRQRVVFFAQSTQGGPYDTLLCFGYGRTHTGQVLATGYGLDPHELRQGLWNKLVLPAGQNPLCSAIVTRTPNTQELWVGCADGVIYRLQDPTQVNYALSDHAVAVGADFETTWADFSQNKDANGIPRFLSLTGSAVNGGTWTVILTFASRKGGATLNTSTFTVKIPAGAFSVVVGIQNAINCGAMKLRLQNFNLAEDGRFSGLHVKYIPKVFRGVRAA